MQRYREALTYLNLALDAMVLEGDTVAIAMIAHPISTVEQAIHRRSNEIIDRMVSAPSRE
jgi:hypothetical protein